MTKFFIVAAALLSLGLGAAQAAEGYQAGNSAGVVAGPAAGIASAIIESNASQSAVHSANSLPLGFDAGTSYGAVQYGTVLGR